MANISMNDGDDGFVVVSTTDCPCDSATRYTSPSLLEDINVVAENVANEFWPVNIKIHDNPELGYEEFIAHQALTSFMKRRRAWKVTPSAYGMETAWIAVYDSGKRGAVVSFNAEMGGGGKIELLKKGAYSDHKVDISLISHPGIIPDAARMLTTAYEQFKAEYYGREAHAAANPWLGINALDALISAYNNVSMLRQQSMPGDIIQGHITDGGMAPNIIHAYAAGQFVIRASTQSRLEKLRKKVLACFEAGAKATGARLVVTRGGAYKDHVPNEILAQSYTRYFNALDPEHNILENAELDRTRGTVLASTDQGDVSYAMPSLSAAFYIRPGPQGQGPHNPEFAEAARTKEAYCNAVRVAKGLAGVALDVLEFPDMLERAKKSWRDSMGWAGHEQPEQNLTGNV
ncbi:hypothetical protein QQS21_000861 [Conoideocrella luteorostrata]|uniref:Peptidase M20 domain-containing protein 2 n=1 Tax=Conoideocrella luteorostrata TaxID=1105319 RepID=A0AAJ0D0L5_9HYPO|nr:hypothetical protein QQS21_000861 [Conoideocrella luteorostrata]